LHAWALPTLLDLAMMAGVTLLTGLYVLYREKPWRWPSWMASTPHHLLTVARLSAIWFDPRFLILEGEAD